jgi:predicted MPP superfamily phosphohydrolase
MARVPGVSRRRFLLQAAAAPLLAGSAAYGYAWGIEPHWVEFVERDLPIANLPAPLAGKVLVQLSDLHAGPEVDDAYLIDTLRRVSDLGADVHVLTGDYMTCRRGEEVRRAERVLAHLRPARLASLAVLGNHDYGEEHDQLAVALALTARLEGLGIEVLSNAARDVGGLTVAGLDDFWGPRFSPRAVLRTLDPARANLVLCHNPDAADEPVWAGYRGWLLCGHTHGGQCKPPLLPPPFLPVRNRNYVAGEVDLGDGRRLYINRGLGHLRRARFNVRPEVTVFTLRRALPANR